MATRRKRCKVRVMQEVVMQGRGIAPYKSMSFSVCMNKIKPGTPFCREHFETHRLIDVKCTGEAHSNPYIDHCFVCLPHWGHYPFAVLKSEPGKPWEGSWD
jgi:hypothetical protein